MYLPIILFCYQTYKVDERMDLMDITGDVSYCYLQDWSTYKYCVCIKSLIYVDLHCCPKMIKNPPVRHSDARCDMFLHHKGKSCCSLFRHIHIMLLWYSVKEASKSWIVLLHMLSVVCLFTCYYSLEPVSVIAVISLSLEPFLNKLTRSKSSGRWNIWTDIVIYFSIAKRYSMYQTLNTHTIHSTLSKSSMIWLCTWDTLYRQ